MTLASAGLEGILPAGKRKNVMSDLGGDGGADCEKWRAFRASVCLRGARVCVRVCVRRHASLTHCSATCQLVCKRVCVLMHVHIPAGWSV